MSVFVDLLISLPSADLIRTKDYPTLEKICSMQEAEIDGRGHGEFIGICGHVIKQCRCKHSLNNPRRTYRVTDKVCGACENDSKSLHNHKYGCVLAVLPETSRKTITDWSIENIQDEHLAPDGRELRSHCTVLYGFKDNSEETLEQLRSILTRFGPIQIRLGNEITSFPAGKDGVPLIIPVESEQLHELNIIFRESFDVHVKFPVYHPHITLAYINSEAAASLYFDECPPFLNQEIILNEVEWSDPEGRREIIPLSYVPVLFGAGFNKNNDQDTVALLRKTCVSFAGIPGLGPDYQRLFWNESKKHAWWESFDGDDGDAVREIIARLEKVPGVDKVSAESESSPPHDGNWELVWPERRQWKDLNSYLTKAQQDVKGKPCPPGYNTVRDKCVKVEKEGESEESNGSEEEKPEKLQESNVPEEQGPKLDPDGYPINKPEQPTSEQEVEQVKPHADLLEHYKKPKVKIHYRGSETAYKSALFYLFGKDDVDDGTIGSLANAIDGSIVEFRYDFGELRLSANHEGVYASRKIYRDNKGNLIVYNGSFGFEDGSPHKGKGLDIFTNQVNAARELGATRLETHAAGYGKYEEEQDGVRSPNNGYYTWPRMGYSGTVHDDLLDSMPEDVRRQMSGSEEVLDLMAIERVDVSPKEYEYINSKLREVDEDQGKFPRDRDFISGKDCWLVYGQDIFDATFDLSDNSRSMQVLSDYVKERKGKNVGRSSGKSQGSSGKSRGSSEEIPPSNKSWSSSQSGGSRTITSVNERSKICGGNRHQSGLVNWYEIKSAFSDKRPHEGEPCSTNPGWTTEKTGCVSEEDKPSGGGKPEVDPSGHQLGSKEESSFDIPQPLLKTLNRWKERIVPEGHKLLENLAGVLTKEDSIGLEDKQRYLASLGYVFSRMPAKALEKIMDGAKEFLFHSNCRELTDAMINNVKLPDNFRAKVYLIKKKGGVVGGMYYGKEKMLMLDGDYTILPGTISGEERTNVHEAYAHEFSHAIDGPGEFLSRSGEWHMAWLSDIYTKDITGGDKLSAYARSHVTEGFAEFGRLVYGSDVSQDIIKKHFPKCWRFWQKNGLLK